MNIAYFIARRFSTDSMGKKLLSRSIVRLSVFSIALSVAVMLITLAVVKGFKHEIRKKVVGFGSHIQIINFDGNNSFETQPISSNQDFLPNISAIQGVRHIQRFAIKPGIIKAENENQGVFAKGVGPDFDVTFFNNNLVEGKVLSLPDTGKTNDVMMSKRLAKLLKLKVGDDFPIFFFDEKPRMRRFNICGLFETSLEEFDKQYILADIRHIQRLYNWNEDEISGFEILIDNYESLDEITSEVTEIAGFRFTAEGSRLKIISIKDKYPQIFEWLNLLDMNVIVILSLMIVVAIVNMVTGLIILILDRTNTIGLLKALGSGNQTLRRIFLYQAFFLILKGLLIGNTIGLLLCYIEDKYHILKLDQSSYFINYVPINLPISTLLFTNFFSLVTILIFMILPTFIITRIDPVKTIRYN